MTHRLLLPIFAVLFTAAVSFGLNTFAATFAEPSGTPPANNAAAPLDTSANANTKAGPLTVNSGIVTGTAGPTYGLLVQSGKVGIGTLTPTQTLEVAGIIKSSSGGIMFPDGSIQAVAASGNNGLGQGQTWTNVLSSRAIGATYTNNTGKPIEVIVSHVNWVKVYVNGLNLLQDQGGNQETWTATPFIVPTGATYRVDSDGIQMWVELR